MSGAEVALLKIGLDLLSRRQDDELRVAIATLEDRNATKANKAWASKVIQKKADEYRRASQRGTGFGSNR